MANPIKLEIEKSKLKLEFFKARNEEQPHQIYSKWVEIYQERLKKLEKQYQKLQQKAQAAATNQRP